MANSDRQKATTAALTQHAAWALGYSLNMGMESIQPGGTHTKDIFGHLNEPEFRADDAPKLYTPPGTIDALYGCLSGGHQGRMLAVQYTSDSNFNSRIKKLLEQASLINSILDSFPDLNMVVWGWETVPVERAPLTYKFREASFDCVTSYEGGVEPYVHMKRSRWLVYDDSEGYPRIEDNFETTKDYW